MLRNIKELQGLELLGKDGHVGKAVDFFFDDAHWTVRYLVARTGSWFQDKRVLLSPLAIERAAWDAKQLHLSLTREQVQNSPDIDVDRPVSRQQEIAYHRHFGWAGYWGFGAGVWGPFGLPGVLAQEPWREPVSALEREAEEQLDQRADKHLHSCKEVLGYALHATDGLFGHVSDFLVDDESWTLRYLVVDTRTLWLGGKHVLVSTQWLSEVSWTERSVFVELPSDAVRTSPEWTPALPVTRAYEERLFAHYARPGYWKVPEDEGAVRPYPTDHDVHPGL